jgi:hypothetical protein
MEEFEKDQREFNRYPRTTARDQIFVDDIGVRQRLAVGEVLGEIGVRRKTSASKQPVGLEHKGAGRAYGHKESPLARPSPPATGKQVRSSHEDVPGQARDDLGKVLIARKAQLLLQRNVRDAVDSCREAISYSPSYADAHLRQAKPLLKSGDAKRSMEALQGARRLDLDNSEVLNLLRDLLFK